jgi:hypothetical protein
MVMLNIRLTGQIAQRLTEEFPPLENEGLDIAENSLSGN